MGYSQQVTGPFLRENPDDTPPMVIYFMSLGGIIGLEGPFRPLAYFNFPLGQYTNCFNKCSHYIAMVTGMYNSMEGAEKITFVIMLVPKNLSLN